MERMMTSRRKDDLKAVSQPPVAINPESRLGMCWPMKGENVIMHEYILRVPLFAARFLSLYNAVFFPFLLLFPHSSGGIFWCLVVKFLNKTSPFLTNSCFSRVVV